MFGGMLKFFQDLLNFVSPQLLKYVGNVELHICVMCNTS